MSDPAGLTGRAEIWQTTLAYMRDHPLLGAGFGTIAHTGALSPLHGYARESWVEAIADSHNGYLQILIATGGIGLRWLYGAWWRIRSCVSGRSIRRMWNSRRCFSRFSSSCWLHNFMETDFLESDNDGWFAFLVMLASLRARDNSLTLRP